jgi:hypothetical protein
MAKTGIVVSERVVFETPVAYVHQTLANGSWVYK